MGLNFDYTTGSVAGQKAKAEGMAKVAKPNAAWIIRCHKAIPFLPKYIPNAIPTQVARRTYTGEDIKLAIRAKVGEPTHPNAWGPMIAGAF